MALKVWRSLSFTEGGKVLQTALAVAGATPKREGQQGDTLEEEMQQLGAEQCCQHGLSIF